MTDNERFTFGISLSVLNNLGRNLYRSFVTVLGEAISNSWDADAKNVWIQVNKKENSFFIKDDGEGMSSKDFQHKFLRVGYSKRAGGKIETEEGRPFIGRKGIGKLALLSCAESISVISKTRAGDYIGGKINNSDLDQAIEDDLEPSNYPLSTYEISDFENLTEGHEKGTIIYFENLKDGIKRSIPYLRKIVALYFRFSLLDDQFNIFLNGEKISVEDIKDLARNTQFLWKINSYEDAFVEDQLTNILNKRTIVIEGTMNGFIASVERPSNLRIFGKQGEGQERVGVDLFVNGRLRERNILQHIPSSRLAENYIYGQIHYNELDDGRDRFTSSREGIIADDEKFQDLLNKINEIVVHDILEDWDKWRIAAKYEGDVENKRITRRERSSKSLYNAVSADFVSGSDEESEKEGDVKPTESTSKDKPTDAKDEKTTLSREKIDKWVDELSDDATYNFDSYAECFIAENLIRKYIDANGVKLTDEAERDIKKYKEKEEEHKRKGGLSIDIRREPDGLGYLSMDSLATLVDNNKRAPTEPSLYRSSLEYKPVRDALMHTALLTSEAKTNILSTRNNIKGRVRTLVEMVEESNGEGVES